MEATLSHQNKRDRNQQEDLPQVSSEPVANRKIIKAKRHLKPEDAAKENNPEGSDLEFECSEEEILEPEDVVEKDDSDSDQEWEDCSDDEEMADQTATKKGS